MALPEIVPFVKQYHAYCDTSTNGNTNNKI